MMTRAEFWYKHFEKLQKKLQEILMKLITIMNRVQLSVNLKSKTLVFCLSDLKKTWWCDVLGKYNDFYKFTMESFSSPKFIKA